MAGAESGLLVVGPRPTRSTPCMTDLQYRFQRLDTLLQHTAGLWRPQPYKDIAPAWSVKLPALAQHLLALSDAELALYAATPATVLHMLERHWPGSAELIDLSRLPVLPAIPLRVRDPHLECAIPGRKWQQITAFVAAVPHVRSPLLEWCGGKGHLGRLFGRQHGVAVTTLERDAALCAAGERLAQRARIDQKFQVIDVLGPDAAHHVIDHHAVALHACGELHRTLLRQAVAQQVRALDIAPCCYHLGSGAEYQAFSRSTTLSLHADDLRLAVTETVTSAPREVRKRDLEMAWKLGFELLRREVSSAGEYRSIKPIEKRWLALGFEGFCRQLAQREALPLPASVDWAHYQALGRERQRQVMRLSLPRQAMRRALELWLVLDMVNYLIEQGYRVALGTFCPHAVTPRNILISARL